MKRRDVVAALGGALLWPMSGRAQSADGPPRIGLVYPGPMAALAPRQGAILEGLRRSGFSESQVEFVVRATNGDLTRVAPLISEVLAKRVHIYVAIARPLVQAAQTAVGSLPIVAFDLESDPVASGFAQSLARPGKNITGVFLDFPDLASKWLELLSQSVPNLARVAVLWDPNTGRAQIEAATKAAEALKIAIDTLEVKVLADVEAAFKEGKARGAGAAVMLSTPVVGPNSKQVADFALAQRLPAITLFPDFARGGGLLAYGPELNDIYRRAGVLIGKVLKGEKPANIAIERPSQFQLVVNKQTATAFGISLPTSILLRADEVID
jgi:putative ABC transport system substrate-binding protein